MRFRSLHRLVQAVRVLVTAPKVKQRSTHLIAHSEPPIVDRRPPKICHERDIKEIDEIQPPIQDEPPRLPMIRDKTRIAPRSEGKGVEEEKGEYDQNAAQNAPP